MKSVEALSAEFSRRLRRGKTPKPVTVIKPCRQVADIEYNPDGTIAYDGKELDRQVKDWEAEHGKIS